MTTPPVAGVIPPLRPGDRVAVVSPAGPCPPELLDRGLGLLRSWGLEVVLTAHARDRHPVLPYLAGADADRAADFTAAWCDPSVRAVLCARGGYGSERVVDLVDWAAVAAAGPKVFAGSSDTTTLHGRLWRLGVPTWFGPMVATAAFVEDATAREHLRHALFSGVEGLSGDSSGSLPGVPVVPGRATGTAVGGTVSLLGGTTPPEGAIALLEDVHEEPYRLDHLLTGLLRQGWFDRVAGVALGSWVDCGEPAEVEAVLVDRLGGLGVPVLGSVGFGHCAGQRTVPLGVTAVLDADAGLLTVAR
ncbi:muramoyltetrapeptide carboxypeptidase [Saccharothrix coeruleofusca]|uniref:S66 peptidase family protein n=1 Tax=Saccharothrix coeruleofusca TaxID=33919 RepID=UPI0027DC8116|nr:LD-carboxypeptidase [Saccharothrix coeruleofusca]MBP2336345.1 muramoyltetrapeptide carboxypeptidase [Saccharothrix coeruleofusca]